MNDETYTPCTKCGRPLSYCKGQCCGKAKGCECQEYGPKVCGAIRPGEPKCPYQAVIPSLTVESVGNLKDLADCFVHVSDINTTFYIDDKHRIMTTWAGLVSVENYDFDANPLNLRDQIAYDAKNNTAAIYNKQGANYIFQISDINNDYMLLENKPQINGVTLEGNKTSADLGIPDVDEVALVFDTVADMKAATNLVNGSYARTLGFHAVNDGGSALYKIRTPNSGETADEKFIIAIGDSLIAELICDDLVNICQVGGQQNTASVCNYVISSMGKSVYIPAKSFNLTETIHINNNYTKFICDGDLTVTTEDIAGICLRANRCIVKLNGELTAEDGIGLEICGGDHHAFDDDIFFNSITAKIGVLVDPDNGKGFQTSKISFNRINASEIGISLAPQNTGNPWVTTLTVYAGHITSPYPIRFRKGANQTDRFNQIVFYDITFSGTIQTAIDIQRCQGVYFYRCRMVEGMTGDTWIKLDDCGFVHVDNEGFTPVNKISITNPMTETYPNFLSAQMLTNSTQNAIATRAMTYKGSIIMLDDPINKYDTYITSYDTDSFSTPEYYYNGMIVEVGSSGTNETLVYELPEVFNKFGVNEFYIYVKNKDTTSTLKVWDYQHNTMVNLPTGQTLSNKRWHVKYIKYLNGNPQWIVTTLN